MRRPFFPPFHWAESNWGREWAAKCYPDHESLKKEEGR